MKRIFVLAGLLCALTTGVAAAQTRVGVSLTFGDPHFAGELVIGRPYYHRYAHPYYHRYRPIPRYFRVPRVVVVRPSRRYVRGSRRHW